MDKTGRDILKLAAVEGGIILACALISKIAKAAPPPAKGEATIKGQITESEHLLPIPYATVKLDGLMCSADENGEYQIIEVPTGTFLLTASASGYNSKTIEVTVKTPATYTRNIELEPVISALARIEEI